MLSDQDFKSQVASIVQLVVSADLKGCSFVPGLSCWVRFGRICLLPVSSGDKWLNGNRSDTQENDHCFIHVTGILLE